MAESAEVALAEVEEELATVQQEARELQSRLASPLAGAMQVLALATQFYWPAPSSPHLAAVHIATRHFASMLPSTAGARREFCRPLCQEDIDI